MDTSLTAAQVLFAPVFDKDFELPDGGRVLYLNARYHTDIQDVLRTVSVDYCQFFKSYAAQLEGAGWHDVSCLEHGAYDVVFVNIPKNMEEARILMQNGIAALKTGGTLFCAAHNKAGGNRLQKMLQDYGAQHIAHRSSQKCRVVYGDGFAAIDGCLDVPWGQQTVCEDAFQSMPGLYGWDKIDRGSLLLASAMPDIIKARRAADFGCGYGFLARTLAARMAAPFKLYAIDADRRAVDMCAINVPEVEALWADILAHPLPKNLDFIAMNPPFHEGKKTSTDIGQTFISRAAKSLRPGGALWMVANTHLPYESVLRAAFKTVETVVQKDGFKVFKATV